MIEEAISRVRVGLLMKNQRGAQQFTCRGAIIGIEAISAKTTNGMGNEGIEAWCFVREAKP